MKTILVSGAGGFLGTQLIKHLLLEESTKLFALTGRKDRLESLYGHDPKFSVISEFPKGIDVFINCVFPTNANGKQLANGLDYITDLFLKAHENGVGAVINISTQSVYDQKKDAKATETMIPDLGTKYAVGKYAVEKIVGAIFKDTPYSNLRMASLIGPNSDGRIMNRFVKQVIAGKDVHIVADSQMFGFLDVRDAAAGIGKYASIHPEKWEEVLNLGSRHSYSLREVAECVVCVGKEFGFSSSVMIGEEIGDVRNSLLDGSKFENLVKWKPEIPMEKTIRDAYLHYLNENEE